MTSARETLDAAIPRLADALLAQRCTLEVRIEARADVEDHLLGPLVTLLLSTARYAVTWKPYQLTVRDRAGGDVEIRIDGLELPPDFPAGAPEADLWSLATGFLREFHRARIGHAEDRVLLLVPGRTTARALRDGR